MPALIHAYGQDQLRRGLLESTVVTTRYMLLRFNRWLDPRGLLDVTTGDIERYLDSLQLQPKSRYWYLSNLHSFYEWARWRGHTEADPTVAIRRPRFRNGLPRPVGDHDLALALDKAYGPVLVMLSLAAFAGMRSIEISRLTREDVLDQSEPRQIIAHGKGNKPRVLPLHDRAWDALDRLPMPRSGPVLRRPDGRPFNPTQVSQRGSRFLHELGIDATMHQLRHWFGTTLYRTSERDLLLVRDMLGHSNVTTTTVYAAYDRLGAVDAVRRLGTDP